MSKPNNSIATVKLPGDTNARPIVPYYVGYSSNNNYVATLPALTSDVNFVITDGAQEIGGKKTFTSAIGLYDWQTSESIDLRANDDVIHFYDNDKDSFWNIEMWATNLKFQWMNSDGDTYVYDFPTQSGTLGLQIDIEDLTSL